MEVRSSLLSLNQRRGAERYIRVLSFLRMEKVLGNGVVYVPSGFDFFPALHSQLFALNNRSINGFDFFIHNISNLGLVRGDWESRLRQNLHYINIADATNVGAVREKALENGFGSIRGRKSLLLKGTILDLFSKEFDRDTEVYREQKDYIPTAKRWFDGMLGMFGKGDTVIAFDGDLEFFPHRRCKEILSIAFADLPDVEILMESPSNATTRIYMPQRLRAMRIL